MKGLSVFIIKLGVCSIVMFVMGFIMVIGMKTNSRANSTNEIDRLLAYFNQLPPYAVLYVYNRPLTERNFDCIITNEYKGMHDGAPCASVAIFFYALGANVEIMEDLNVCYDEVSSSPLMRNIYKFNGEETYAFSTDANWLVKSPERSSMFQSIDISIQSEMNPLAGDPWPYAEEQLLKNLRALNGKIVSSVPTKPVRKVECVLPESGILSPPVELRRYSGDKLMWDIKIKPAEFECRDGQKWIYPVSITNTQYLFIPAEKVYIKVLHFDKLNSANLAGVFELNIPDNAAVYDKALDLHYVNKAPHHEHLKEPYSTKFEFFGITLNEAKQLIDRIIREDRKRYAANQAAPH